MLSCVQMALTDGRGSSYIDSICVLVPVMFVACRLRAALIFALLLLKMMIMETATLILKVVAREPMDTMYTVLVSVG